MLGVRRRDKSGLVGGRGWGATSKQLASTTQCLRIIIRKEQLPTSSCRTAPEDLKAMVLDPSYNPAGVTQKKEGEGPPGEMRQRQVQRQGDKVLVNAGRGMDCWLPIFRREQI